MSRLTYPKEYYQLSTYYGVHPLDEGQMRKEYEKLSRKANKYLGRIERSEFGGEQFYRQFYGQFDKPAAELSGRELAYKLRELSRYLGSQKATYTGARESRREAVRSMKEAGFDWVTYKNYGSFADFMDLVKTSYGEHLYDSKRVVEYYEENKKKGVSPAELFADFVTFQGGKNVRNTGYSIQ